ncbi:MAG: hypothetical protein IT423_11125 [Pirellulaceae bacterium]|nr:hypothetical protein [Pirellulaceae bacterium]
MASDKPLPVQPARPAPTQPGSTQPGTAQATEANPGRLLPANQANSQAAVGAASPGATVPPPTEPDKTLSPTGTPLASNQPEANRLPAGSGEPVSRLPAKKVEPEADEAGGPVWLPPGTQLPLEYWEAHYRNSKRIGVSHYKIEDVDGKRLKLTTETKLPMLQSGQAIRQSVSVETIEQPNGQLDSYYETMTSGQFKQETQGAVTNGQLKLQTSGSSNSSKQVAWPEAAWGPLGMHQLLRRQPMEPGQERVANVFLAQTHQLARVTLVAGPSEETTSPTGLLTDMVRIDAVMQLEKQGIRVRLWADAQGVVHKTIWPEGLNYSSFRISAADAQRMLDQDEVEFWSGASVKVTTPAVDLSEAARVRYEIQSETRDPHLLFSGQTNQSVLSHSAYAARVLVYRSSAEAPPALPDPALTEPAQPVALQPAPEIECQFPSAWINSDDKRVIKLAEQLAGDTQNKAEITLKLTEGVSKLLKPRDFSSSIDTAQIVVQRLEGDSTEFAVLLAALLRSRDIPSRIASGVLLSEPAVDPTTGTVNSRLTMAYHMWTEAWLGDRWLAVDATLGTPAGCRHLKFLETPLSDSNPYSAVVPVVREMSKLTVSVTTLP